VPLQPTLRLRREELARRVEALPAEVAGWRERSKTDLDMEVHFSQLEALSILTDALVDRQRTLLDALAPEANPDGFYVKGFELVVETIKAQRVWDFFRDKLELRFSPDFKDVLWVADTIAWDCYRPVMGRATDAGMLSKAHVREPPLTYLTAEFSPATWVRGSRPNDGREYHLGTANLPIPVIEVPWDHVGNLWELVSLHHEVGHDIEADLQLRAELLLSLQTVLAARTPPQRIDVWKAWVGEVFADLVGLQLGGPGFSYGLLNLLLLPLPDVVGYNAADPHPTHYVRLLMNAAYMRTLAPGTATLDEAAADVEAIWTAAYGDAPEHLAPFIDDFPAVFTALMDSPFTVLKGETVRSLMPYSAGDEARIIKARDYLETGLNAPAPATFAPRHAVSAARLAASKVAAENGNTATVLEAINERTAQLVRDSAPGGLRAGDGSKPHQDFIRSFAARV
jgi:hypothetical protein